MKDKNLKYLFALFLAATVAISQAQLVEPVDEVSDAWIRWMFDQEPTEGGTIVMSAADYRRVLEAINNMNSHYQQMYRNYDALTSNLDDRNLEVIDLEGRCAVMAADFSDMRERNVQLYEEITYLQERHDTLSERYDEVTDQLDQAMMQIEFLQQDNSDL